MKPIKWHRVDDREEDRTYLMRGNSWIGEIFRTRPEYEENADSIIVAMNSHQAMKEALELVLQRSQEADGWGDDVDRDAEVVNQCAQALTLANGGSTDE